MRVVFLIFFSFFFFSSNVFNAPAHANVCACSRQCLRPVNDPRREIGNDKSEYVRVNADDISAEWVRVAERVEDAVDHPGNAP